MKRQSDNAPDADIVARSLDAPAVDPDVAGLDDCLRKSAAFHQSNAVKEAVDPHFFLSFASSAKAWLGAAIASVVAEARLIDEADAAS